MLKSKRETKNQVTISAADYCIFAACFVSPEPKCRSKRWDKETNFPQKYNTFRKNNISGSALAGYWRFWLLAGKDSRIAFTHLRTVHLAGDFRIYCHYVEFPIFININMRTQVFANKFLASDVEFTCAENANLTLSDHNNSAFDTKCFSMAEYNVVGEGPRIVRECSKFDYSQAAYKVNLNSTK